MHSRRALLYMPGDDWHKINKALTLGVDCICMDMEDGVALNRKQAPARPSPGPCRSWTSATPRNWRASTGSARVWRRTTSQAVLPFHPDGIVIPKIEALDQIQWAQRDHRGGRTGKRLAASTRSACWWTWRPPKASST